jgi:hypothetical protein
MCMFYVVCFGFRSGIDGLRRIGLLRQSLVSVSWAHMPHNAVRIEPSQHAMEAGLAEVCILSACIFLDQTGLPVDWPCMLVYFLKIYVFNRSW